MNTGATGMDTRCNYDKWQNGNYTRRIMGKYAPRVNLCIFMTATQDIICKSEGEQIGLKRHLHAIQSTDKQKDAPLCTTPSCFFTLSVLAMEMMNNAAVLFAAKWEPSCGISSILMLSFTAVTQRRAEHLRAGDSSYCAGLDCNGNSCGGRGEAAPCRSL